MRKRQQACVFESLLERSTLAPIIVLLVSNDVRYYNNKIGSQNIDVFSVMKVSKWERWPTLLELDHRGKKGETSTMQNYSNIDDVSNPFIRSHSSLISGLFYPTCCWCRCWCCCCCCCCCEGSFFILPLNAYSWHHEKIVFPANFKTEDVLLMSERAAASFQARTIKAKKTVASSGAGVKLFR